MALYVHRAERADRLVTALAEVLAEPLPDPFAEEIVAVPARGIERWLTQQLSHRLGRREGRSDGICAAVRFPSPAQLVEQILGVERGDPYEPDRMVWPLLAEIDASAGAPWCAALSRHLGVDAVDGERTYRQGRRYAVARRLAGLFAGYAVQRPSLLVAWTAGDDEDGCGVALPVDLRWQAELWRRLRGRIDGLDPVQRAASVRNAVLPQRLSLFGPTRLPAAHVDVLSAVAETRDVHLWVPHPSPALWDVVADTRPQQRIRRSADSTTELAQHPLLASLGRDSRELQLLLPPDAVPVHHAGALDAAPERTLLHRLQDDLRDNRRPDGTHRLDPADRSIQVHACHGPSRQVDVLREVLVGLLAADPTLEPRDLLVMCPDIEVYAPLVAAAFGLAGVGDSDDGIEIPGHPAHRLRVRLADRALTQTNPLLSTVARLLDLADARVTTAQLLDFCTWAPVRRRFGFADDDLEKMAQWCADAGIRWGLDAAARRPFKLDGFSQNTWRAGLDRMLLGAALASDDRDWLGLALPLDDVGSGDVDLAGRLAELVDRLDRALQTLNGERTLRGWLAALTEAVLGLTDVVQADGWQLGELHREFAAISEAADGGAEVLLRLSDIRALLGGRLGGRPTRSNFRTGNLTVCTLVPMRSVPHRVVCLLGLDDGTFPRSVFPDGDDVLARDPLVGERDRRGEDRQLMLDAILAATEHLVITYTGADERTGALRPPCVPVGELLDALDETVVPSELRAQDRVVIRHPLQPFDVRNCLPDGPGAGVPFSHDPAVLEAALASMSDRRPPPSFLAEPLPPAPEADLALPRLIEMLQNPAAGFLRQRLDTAVAREADEADEAIPVALDALQGWAVGNRLLVDRLAGVGAEHARQAEWRRGTLPPGRLGSMVLDEQATAVDTLVNATSAWRSAERQTLDVVVGFDGWQLTGAVPGVYDRTLLTVTFSRLSAKDRLAAWIRLVVASVAYPDVPWEAVTVAKGAQAAVLAPIGIDRAHAALAQLIQLYRRGTTEPLPLPVKTGLAYAEARSRHTNEPNALAKARRMWQSDKFPGEDADPAFVQVWGRAVPFEDFARAQPLPGERWSADGTRFGQLAVRLWGPLLAVERLAEL